MNESITPDAGAMAIGAPDWLEHAPRRDLIKYIRELQLQIAALGGKNLPSASGRMRSSRSHTTSSVSTRQKQRESATSLTSHSSTTSAHTIMSQSSEAKDGASIKSRKSNDSEDRRKAPVPLARLRSIGSMDDVTNGNLMLQPTMEEPGKLKVDGLTAFRRQKRRDGSLRSRSGSISNGRAYGINQGDTGFELSSDMQARVDAQNFSSVKYSTRQVDAAIVIQRRWREYRLRQRFNIVKRRMMRKSLQKQLELLYQGSDGAKPMEKIEERRKQLMSMQTPTAASASPVGFSSGLSGNYPWMPEDCQATEDIERQRLHRLAVYQFNRNVRKGLDWMIANKAIKNEANSIALFLRAEKTLNRRAIGELLGERDTAFGVAILSGYVDLFDFQGLEFDRAIRTFLGSFRLPGEAQKIERILEVFARRYHDTNPGIFAHADTPFILSFSIVMLNTDIHNEANKRKMSMEDFVRNNRGIDDGEDLPHEYLQQIYTRIAEDEFKAQGDNITMIESIIGTMAGKTSLDLAAAHRQFVSKCSVTALETFDKSKAKQSTKARVLFLFNDLLLVAKQHAKGKYHPKQVIPLLGLGLALKTSEHVANGIQITNKFDRNEVILRFFIENLETSTMAKNFVTDLREMIWQCEAIEATRFNKLNLKGPLLDFETAEATDADVASVGSSESFQSEGSSRSRGRSIGKKFGLSLRKKGKAKDIPRMSQLFPGADANSLA